MKRLITINEKEIFERLDWARICRAIRESDSELKNHRVRDLANALGWTSWPATGEYSKKLLADYCEWSAKQYGETQRALGEGNFEILQDVLVHAFLVIEKRFPPMDLENYDWEDARKIFDCSPYLSSIEELFSKPIAKVAWLVRIPWRTIIKTVGESDVRHEKMVVLAEKLGLRGWPSGSASELSSKILEEYCAEVPFVYSGDGFGEGKLKVLIAVLLNAYALATNQETTLGPISRERESGGLSVKEALEKKISESQLQERELTILKRRYCLFEVKEVAKTTEIAEELNIAQPSISQTTSRVIEKLRRDSLFVESLNRILEKDLDLIRTEILDYVRVGYPLPPSRRGASRFLQNLRCHKLAIDVCFENCQDFLDAYFERAEEGWDFSKVKTDAGSGDGVAEEDAEPGAPVADAPEDAADVPAEETPEAEGEAPEAEGDVPAAEPSAPEALSEKPVAEPPPLPAVPKKGWLGKLLSIFRKNN